MLALACHNKFRRQSLKAAEIECRGLFFFKGEKRMERKIAVLRIGVE